MLKRHLFIGLSILYYLTFSFQVYAQYPNWKNYTEGSLIYEVRKQGNFMWVGTRGGLLKINTTTSETTFYDKTNSGLPDNHVTSIAFDSTGNAWVGTWNGLGFFDGTNWVSYNTENSILPSNGIGDIYVSPQNVVWIGTFGGYLIRIQNSIWTLFDYSSFNMPTAECVYSIAGDNENNIWVGCAKNCILKFDGTSWHTFTLPDSALVYDINVQGDSIWVAAYSCIIKIKDTSITTINGANWGLHNYGIYKTFIEENNDIWVTTGDGVVNIKPDGQKFYYNDTNSSLQCNNVWKIEKDNNGRLWFGTYGRGMARFDGTNWDSPITSACDLLNNDIFQMSFDKNGILWALSSYFDCQGFANSRIISYDQNNNIWKSYSEVEMGFSFPIKDIDLNTILVDSDNNKWFIHDNLIKYDNTTWSIIPYPANYQNMIGTRPYRAGIDMNNNIYISGYPSMLKYRDGIWTYINPKTIANNSLVQNVVILDICGDSSNNMWLICEYDIWSPSHIVFHDLVKYDGTNFTSFHIPVVNQSLPQAIAAEKNGNIWISCMKGNLFKFDGTNFINYWPANDHTDLWRIDIDNKNNLWICTDYGLYKYSINDSVITNYHVNNSGIPYNVVTSIGFDNYGNKWIGTIFSGIAVFNEDSNFYPHPPSDTSTNNESIYPIIFPNPASDIININLSSFTKSELVRISFYDLAGRLIKEMQFVADDILHRINISDISDSIYFVVFNSNSGNKCYKIIII